MKNAVRGWFREGLHIVLYTDWFENDKFAKRQLVQLSVFESLLFIVTGGRHDGVQ